MSAGPRTVDRHLVRFADALREAGVAVSTGSTVDYGESVALVGLEDPEVVYWAGRATLVRRPEDVPVYDRVFDEHWRRRTAAPPSIEVTETVTIATDDGDEGDDAVGDDGDGPDGEVITVRFSRAEVLGAKDFAHCSASELRELHDLMARIPLLGARRSSRRRRRSSRDRGRPDLRRTVDAALRTGGEPMHRRFTEPGERARRLVLLLDVSGSMEPYARALIRFVHASIVGRAKVEAFALGTRLTRLTRELSNRDPDSALAAAAAAVEDWSGGTRLGEGIAEFNSEWGVRGMARGADVVILSDGWDRGDPAVMGEAMARLARVAHRVIWVNPLKASPGYAPLAQGMAAALPHVDRFVEGHNLDSLDALAEVIDG